MSEPLIDPRLAEYGTPRQAEFVAAVNEHGGQRAAARALGIQSSAIQSSLKRLMRLAPLRGYESDVRRPKVVVPDMFVVKGKSTYYDAEGVPKQEWVKTRLDGDRMQEAIRAACEAMADEVPRLDPIQAPAQSEVTLCNLYTLTDAHIGARAWRLEGGVDWDLKIAEATILGCFERMMIQAPPARTAVISQLGDFLHWDGPTPVTPTSGHVLDADGRFSKVVKAAIRILRRIIDIALMRHQEVHLVVAEGNHDLASSMWLRHMFSALYENEPRLTVNASELPFYVHQHGNVMLGFHHGHKVRPEGLPLLFASEYAAVWGATKHRYVHTGHVHHEHMKEYSGVKVVGHPTLAARDAHASRGGWISSRQASAITYHSHFGKVGEVIVSPEMVISA